MKPTVKTIRKINMAIKPVQPITSKQVTNGNKKLISKSKIRNKMATK
jgi:hypothetical protein